MFKYSLVLQWSKEDEGYVALIPELPAVSAVGDTPEEAVAEVKDAAALYLEFLNDEGLSIPEPDILPTYSGQLRVRMPRSLHAHLAMQAQIEGVSLNSYIVHLLSFNADRNEIKKDISKNDKDYLKQIPPDISVSDNESPPYIKPNRGKMNKTITSHKKRTAREKR